MLGGVAGVLIALYTNAVFPHMGQPMLHKGIAVVILGGMGDIRGALLGGFFLGFAEVFSVAYIGSTMRDAVAFGLLFHDLAASARKVCSATRRSGALDVRLAASVRQHSKYLWNGSIVFGRPTAPWCFPSAPMCCWRCRFI